MDPSLSDASRPLRSRLPAARLALGVALAACALRLLAPAAAQPTDPYGYTNFETEPVRPLALSPDGELLYALNTADDRLEVLAPTDDGGLQRLGEVAVGLRPVAVAVRSPEQVFVANHLSDTVSVVDASDPARPRLVRTIAVGDEPRDLVVAGPNRDVVLVATAHRAEPTTPGVGRGAVWVIDADDPAAAPREIVVPGMKLRAMAVSDDGRTAYAAVFRSGNRTTMAEPVALDRIPPPWTSTPVVTPWPTPIDPQATPSPIATIGPTPTLGVPPPAAPSTGRIVQQQSDGRWLDERGEFMAIVPFELPDQDLFVLDTSGPGVDAVRVAEAVSGVGTTLFDVAVRPGTGGLWVAHQEANNVVRHEPRLRGRAVDHRIARLVPGAIGEGDDAWRIAQARLNPHLPQAPALPADPVPSPDDAARSLAQIVDVVFEPDGERAYAAALGSGQVAVLDGGARVVGRVDVGFGPGGLALDAARGRLYVLEHLAASIAVVDTATLRVIATVPLAFDPTPPEVRDGRPFFYDARLASASGDQSCAGCHAFGDMDGLAWDLGDPAGKVDAMPFELTHEQFVLKPRTFAFHPEKGPMVTQSLRGLAGTGPLHWRGDRFGPAGRRTDSLAAFARFNGAFVTLNGRAAELAPEEMDAFGRFVLSIRYPPNPHQQVDRSLTPAEARGLALFDGPDLIDSGVSNCAGCHALPAGTNGRINFDGAAVTQDFKAPHLRNLYEKVGRFDVRGPQVSGYGFTHNGATDTIDRFLHSDVFDFPGDDAAAHAAMRADLTAYLLAFDTGMAPAVGRQVTADGALGDAARALLDVLVARAAAGDCDLVARSRAGVAERGWLLADGAFRSDRAAEPPVPLTALLEAASPDQPTTFTCVPPGDGLRSALDRDRDGHLTGDELAAGSDPLDPYSHPGGATPSPTATPRRGTATASTPNRPTATPTQPTQEPPSPTEPSPSHAHVVWLPAAER